jgi:hypothetical protein
MMSGQRFLELRRDIVSVVNKGLEFILYDRAKIDAESVGAADDFD